MSFARTTWNSCITYCRFTHLDIVLLTELRLCTEVNYHAQGYSAPTWDFNQKSLSLSSFLTTTQHCLQLQVRMSLASLRFRTTGFPVIACSLSHSCFKTQTKHKCRIDSHSTILLTSTLYWLPWGTAPDHSLSCASAQWCSPTDEWAPAARRGLCENSLQPYPAPPVLKTWFTIKKTMNIWKVWATHSSEWPSLALHQLR